MHPVVLGKEIGSLSNDLIAKKAKACDSTKSPLMPNLSIDFKPNGPSKSVKSQNSEAFIEENRKITAKNKALIKKIDGNSMVNMIYMRFFLHSVTKDIQNIIFFCLKKNLPQGSLIGLEFRTEKDKDALHIFKRHYRRFIPMQEMINELEKYDFSILYSKESRGFSPFKDEDPFLCRIIAKKM